MRSLAAPWGGSSDALSTADGNGTETPDKYSADGTPQGELMHWYAGRGASEEDAEISKRLRLTGYAA